MPRSSTSHVDRLLLDIIRHIACLRIEHDLLGVPAPLLIEVVAGANKVRMTKLADEVQKHIT